MKIDYCYMELDVTPSEPNGWWFCIGWDKQPDGTMEESWELEEITDTELDTYNLTEESWKHEST